MNCLVSTTFGVLDLPRPGFRIIFLSHAILLPHKAKICAQCLQCNGSVDKFGVLSTSLEWRVNLLRRVRSQLCRAHLYRMTEFVFKKTYNCRGELYNHTHSYNNCNTTSDTAICIEVILPHVHI